MVSPLRKVSSQHNSRVDFVSSEDFQSLGCGDWSGGVGGGGGDLKLSLAALCVSARLVPAAAHNDRRS